MIMKAHLLWLTTVSSTIALCKMGEIDNRLVGLPDVDCQDVAVSLTFNTMKPFTGRVYVKGLVEDDRCSRNFATTSDQHKFSFHVPQGDCNMQRQRVSGALEGIVFSLVVVVSFHGTFETMNDRAFRCMCFFRNVKRVTSGLEVSNMGTTELLDTAKTANCYYSIHADSPTGPLVKYAKVGDRIFHTWECDDQNQGILVHSCWVNDGRGARFDLLDVDGCAIDPIIQPDVQYDTTLSKAYVESWAYKFSDTSVLDYQCVVELCKKSQGECQGLTPPVCGRGKRSVSYRSLEAAKTFNVSNGKHDQHHHHHLKRPEFINDNQMDLVANLHVIESLNDEDTQLDVAPGVPQEFLRQLNQRHAIEHSSTSMTMSHRLNGKTCLATGTLMAMGTTVIIVLLFVVTAGSFLWLNKRQIFWVNKEMA